MRNTSVSQTGTGTTAYTPPDTFQNPFVVSVACTVTGTVNYDVEHTFDDIHATGVLATAVAFPNADLTGKTANAQAVYNYPVKGIRLRVNSGSGTVVMTVVQSGG